MKNKYKNFFISLVAFLATFFTFATAGAVEQQLIPLQGGVTDQQLGLGYGAATGLSAADPRVTAAKIIRNALGLLGTVAVLIIIYAGFLWFTAGGSEEKATQAKSLIYMSVIGLVIILTAYGIAALVVNDLVRATGFGTIPTPFIQQ